jgi:hypothetical protein
MIEQNRKLQGPERFDPFADRTARDIRNSLSEAFVAALAAKDPEQYLNIAQNWRVQNVSSLYADYIDDRLRRYKNVFDAVQTDGINDPQQQAIVIWNQGLFFEFHDLLESLWQAAKGDQRQALKGLIKAAGVYIHLEQQHHQAAQSLAMKSYDLLRQYPHCLSFIANYKTLLESLKNFKPTAPRLEIASFRD